MKRSAIHPQELLQAAPDLLNLLYEAIQIEEDSLHMSEEHIDEERERWLPKAYALIAKITTERTQS